MIQAALPNSPFLERLHTAARTNRSWLCVGLDPEPAKDVETFLKGIVDATRDLVCCYKPNLAFYVAHGLVGMDALARLREDVPAEIPLLLDAKVGDMDNTMVAYALGYFKAFGFDAVTANPFLGRDSLEPLLAYADRGVFILCKTSNPGSGLIQDVQAGGEALSVRIARLAAQWNAEGHGNLGLVVGATYPAQLSAARAAAPDLPILVPGVGAQGGDLEAAVRAGLDRHQAGLLVSASRAVCYASDRPDFQSAARAVAMSLRDVIEAVRDA